jgi:hypothetical protein
MLPRGRLIAVAQLPSSSEEVIIASASGPVRESCAGLQGPQGVLSTLALSPAPFPFWCIGAGDCAPLYDTTALGYIYGFRRLAAQPLPPVTDRADRQYALRFDFRLVSHDCTEPGRAAAMASLLNGTADQPPVHFVLGGNGINAEADAIQANAASRFLLHCCTARDSVFNMDMPFVYGLFTPASLYTGGVLRSMAFNGIERLGVTYWTESALQVQLCLGALRQTLSLSELRSGLGAVAVVNYTAAEAAQPGFWDKTGAQRLGR